MLRIIDNVVNNQEGVAYSNLVLLDFYLKNNQWITNERIIEHLSQNKIPILCRSKSLHYNKFCEPYQINAEQICYDYNVMSHRPE